MKVCNFAVVGQSKRLVAARFHICPNKSREYFFSAKQEIGHFVIGQSQNLVRFLVKRLCKVDCTWISSFKGNGLLKH